VSPLNLMGFYYLAGAFGGVTVCVKPRTAGNDQNLADANSGSGDAVADGYNKAKGGNHGEPSAMPLNGRRTVSALVDTHQRAARTIHVTTDGRPSPVRDLAHGFVGIWPQFLGVRHLRENVPCNSYFPRLMESRMTKTP
jgi:hypothetical protein